MDRNHDDILLFSEKISIIYIGGEIMRAEKINGIPVPYNLTIEELEEMLSTADMGGFVVACEALSYKTEKKAFELLKSYITHKDKYKRLCILKTIFRHPSAAQVKKFLEDSILSDDILFAENGLKIVYEYKIEMPEQVLFVAIFKHLPDLYCTSLYVLQNIVENEINFSKLVELFKQSHVCGQKQVLSNILCSKFLSEKAEELFLLFSEDSYSKLRLLAVRIGKEYSFDISKFYEDSDGHVRAEARKK